MRKPGFEFENIFSLVGYRYIWKITELLTVIILAAILPIKDFALSFLSLTIVYLLISFFKINIYEKDTKKIKKIFNTLSALTPLIGSAVAGLLIISTLFIPTPEARDAIKLTAVIFVFASFTLTPELFFFNRGEYKKLYKIYTISQAATSILAISLALSGIGFKGILYSYVIFYLGNTLMLWQKFPFKLKAKIDKKLLVELYITWRNNLLSTFMSSLYFYGVLLFGVLIYGLVDFASLYLAFTLGFFLYENVTIFINSLLIPRFMEVKDKKEAFDYNLTRVIEYFAFTIIPLTFIFIILSKEFFSFVLDWGMADFISIIIFGGMLKALFETNRIVFITQSKPEIINKIKILELGVLVVLMGVLLPLTGVYGIAVSILISSIIASIFYIVAAARVTKINLVAISKDYFYILFAGVVAALAIGLLKELLYVEKLITVVVLYIVGILIYMLITFMFNKEIYKRFIKFIFNLSEK